MRFCEILSVVVAVGATGCAERLRAGVTLMQPESTQELASVEVGPGRVLDEDVDPMDGVSLAKSEDSVVARFSPPRGPAENERLDPKSLEIISQSRQEDARKGLERTPAPPTQPLRVVVDGGRHVVVLWKEGDGEHGYRAMAQAFNSSDHSPRGAPAAVSPLGADVAGPLNAIKVDDHRVLVAFAASTANGGFAAYAVPVAAP